MKHLLMLLMLVAASLLAFATDYPAACHTTTQLNVRSGPGSYYSKLGTLDNRASIEVQSVVEGEKGEWGVINYRSQRGYVMMHYVAYDHASTPSKSVAPRHKAKARHSFVDFLEGVWNVVRWILTILAILLVIMFWEYLIQIAVFLGFFAGIGALLFHWIFDNSALGAWVGIGVGAVFGLRQMMGSLDIDFSGLMRIAYYVVSFPIYWLNQLEFALSAPWRYIFRHPICSDDTNTVLRPICIILTALLHVATTPLRLFNAAVYNIGIHGITSLYDLFCEVLFPCDPHEGADDTGRWILMFPYRLLKYPLFHGSLSLIESVIWTAVDAFIPAITMYHGTKLDASQSIVQDPYRNKHLRGAQRWSCGNFLSSSDHDVSWGGKGVYFAINRQVAHSYGIRTGSEDMVMIACRVSLGRIINYALTTDRIFHQTGPYGNHSELNRFGEKHGYTTGEWYNARGGYWEYCMFDWQNGYNHPWRIRPIYVYNFRTGVAQHINGGMQHWLFDRTVAQSIFG